MDVVGATRVLASRQRFHHKEKAGCGSMIAVSRAADRWSLFFIVTLGLPT